MYESLFTWEISSFEGWVGPNELFVTDLCIAVSHEKHSPLIQTLQPSNKTDDRQNKSYQKCL